jgi:hypothetical protein
MIIVMGNCAQSVNNNLVNICYVQLILDKWEGNKFKEITVEPKTHSSSFK